ncbi:MAG: GNAT family N-acetyltransferase [Anaerolineae bacterium]
MAAIIAERLPSPEEYNALRASAGWGTYDLELTRACLPRSLYGVCAEIGGQAVGMARIIGDGGLVCYIQDVIVLPEWRGQGIARLLMDAIMAWARVHMAPNAVVGLMAAAGLESFYATYGFQARPAGRYGAGMHWVRPPAPDG